MENQLPLTKSILSTVNPNAVIKHEVFHTLFAEAKKERREVELVNMDTGERTTNLSVLERAEEYAKGFITLNLTPNVDNIAVIGCATFDALAIFAAAAQVGVGFTHPFVHPPREKTMLTRLMPLSPKVVIFGEGAGGHNASALLPLFDSDTPSPSSSWLPFVEHLFYDSSYKDRSPSHKCVKTLNNLRELGESVTAEKLAEVRNNVKPDFSFMHHFTSGSTGTPKCISHFQKTMVLMASAGRFKQGPTLLTNMTMSSMTTYAGLAPALVGNYSCTMVMAPEDYEESPTKELGKLLTEVINRERIVNLFIRPTVLGALVYHLKENQISLDHSMEIVVHGWQITSKQFIEEGERVLKGVTSIHYGMSELTAIGKLLPGDSEQHKRYNREARLYPTPNSVLRIADQQNKLVDIGEVGEIQVKSDRTMKGYRNEEKTKAFFTQDGFAKTGDAGVMFSDGTFKVLGRMSDEQRFKIYGKVEYPGPIEDILSLHPEIIQAAAVSGKLNYWIGDEITACIMTKDRAKRISEEELFDFWKSKGMYERHRPARILYFDEFPITENGCKISKIKLTKQVRDMIAEDESLGKCQWFINKEKSDKAY